MDENSGTKSSFQKKVEECRAVGVLHFKCAEFEFTLDPNWEPPKEEVPVTPVDTTPQIQQGKRGKDGLTAAEQMENYCVVLDAKE